MRKQALPYGSAAFLKRKAKAKSDSRKQKLDHVIALVSEMNEAKLDAVILLLDPPADDDFELSEQDKLQVNERTARYESGKDKAIPAEKVIKELRTRYPGKK